MMKIAAAQIKSSKGNIPKNIIKHDFWIGRACRLNVDFIFFPELSLTGYEPSLASDLAAVRQDNLYDYFQKISDSKNISIGIGLPTRINSNVYISMAIFQPNKIIQIYSKQYLHEDEKLYFSNGNKQLHLEIKSKIITPAICYESLLSEHSAPVNKYGTSIYAASVAKPQSGLTKVMNHYPQIAKQHKMIVIMANSIGPCDNFMSVGKSAVWNEQGELKGQLRENQEALLIYDMESGFTVEELG